jgi:hypothetical protein
MPDTNPLLTALKNGKLYLAVMGDCRTGAASGPDTEIFRRALAALSEATRLRQHYSSHRMNPGHSPRVETSCVASLSARITSPWEIIPTNWRSGPITGKLRLLRFTINWRTRVSGAAGST